MLNASPVLTIIIGVAVMLFLVARQFMARELNVVWLVGLPVVLAYFGLNNVGSLAPAALTLLAINIAVAAALGAVRAATFRVWIGPRGVPLMQGTLATLGLWLALFAVRTGWYAIESAVGVAPDTTNLATYLLPLAGTFAAQNVIVWRRSQSLGVAAAKDHGRQGVWMRSDGSAVVLVQTVARSSADCDTGGKPACRPNF
jgi:hypothetical protein